MQLNEEDFPRLHFQQKNFIGGALKKETQVFLRRHEELPSMPPALL